MTSWLSCSRSTLKHQALGSTFILAAACAASEAPGSEAISRRDSAEIVIIENDLDRLKATCPLDSAPEVTIGVAEGDEEYQLHRVFGARRLSDGTIVLVNQGSQQLRYYDARGRFIDQVGRGGEGPGEFRRAFNLWVLPGDTIWVGDYRPWRFLIFGPDRKWVRTVQAEPMYVNVEHGVTNVLDDGRFTLADRTLRFQPTTNFRMTYLTVLLHDTDGSLLDTIGTYPNGRYGVLDDTPEAMGLRPLFDSYTRITSTGSFIVAGHTSEAEFSLLDVTNGPRVERIVRWTTGDRTITSADIDAEHERIEEQYAEMDANMRRRYLAPLVSDDRPVADRFPAFASLTAGRDGRIWVREYPRPDASGAARFGLAGDREQRVALTRQCLRLAHGAGDGLAVSQHCARRDRGEDR
jgi:hypothetical protein